jgi:hypothetical protein
MIAKQQQFEEESKQEADVKDVLAGMLPFLD